MVFDKGSLVNMRDAVDPKEVAKIVKFVLSLNPDTHIPEVGVKSSKQIS